MHEAVVIFGHQPEMIMWGRGRQRNKIGLRETVGFDEAEHMEGLLERPEGVLVVNHDLLGLGHNIASGFEA